MSDINGTVSVCIPTYNQGKYVETSILSALNQTLSANVHVADDCSTDGTRELLKRMLADHPSLDIHLFEDNAGMGRNATRAVKLATDEFVVKLDSDDIILPTYIESVVRALKSYPEAGYAHVAVTEIDGDGRPTGVRHLKRATGYQQADEALKAVVSGYRVAANIVCFRKSALEQAGYYREDLKFADDWYLSARLADLGWGNVYIDEILANYRVWTDVHGVRPKRKLDEIRGIMVVFQDVLEPSFSKRGWDLQSLRASTRSLALRHAEALRSPTWTPEERSELCRLLTELGDSRSLRLKIRLIESGLGAIAEAPQTAKASLRRIAKSGLRRLRSSRSG
jgi:glycosyltransferase involved in cell wall biosynthesis